MLDLSYKELENLFHEWEEPSFRAGQVWHWIFVKSRLSLSQMTNLPTALRDNLTSRFTVNLPAVHCVKRSRDKTIKFLFRLEDGALIESVLIPEEKYYTQCLSSQVGCPLACTFCSTGSMGFERNLTTAEILGQYLAARLFLTEEKNPLRIRNLVYMGMGEPLLNFDAVLKSLQTFTHPKGPDISSRRITVSTVGNRPEELLGLGESGLAALAVSLHAPNQELRKKIMPKAAGFPLSRLMDILKKYPLQHREKITMEYILMKGVNDSPAHARELVRLLSHIRCKVNLIVINPGEGIAYEPPDPEQVMQFQQLLWSKSMTTTLRKSKGQDISAACGQLKTDLLKSEGSR